MQARETLYPNRYNPLLVKPARPLPGQVAIIGSGIIGPDIGYYLKSAVSGLKLFIVDVVEAPLKDAEKRINGYVQKAITKKKMDEQQARAVMENLVFTTDYSLLKDCDLIIEAATENLELKRKIFTQLEAVVGEEVIITSNTSSLPADRIFSEVKLRL